MSHTGNVTFNSFAAEVLYHADRLDALLFDEYKSALRADMTVCVSDYDGSIGDNYYDLNSSYVQDQIIHHGEH